MPDSRAAAIRHSVCPLDCPDTCSLAVTVEGDRVVKVRGSQANPLTRGAICAKVTRYPELIHGPDRLLTPLRRVGPKGEGRFERISWEQALELIHARFSEIVAAHGPEAILPLNYVGPHGMLAAASMDLRFFHRLGASRLLRKPFCGGVKAEAYVGTFGPVAALRPEHVAEARLIVAWGNNVTVTQLHLMPPINAARKRGARLVVVDPRRTAIAEKADLHLALRPGTDLILAWALAAELERTGGLNRAFIAEHVLGAEDFLAAAREYPPERAEAVCGVPAAEIRQLAEWYRLASPAVICPGNGPERSRNGGNGLRAVFALPALAGKFGVAGGGLLQGHAFAFPKTAARLQGEALLHGNPRTFNIVTIGRTLLDERLSPPIRGLFVYNHNPLIVHPDQNAMRRALAREDLFTVVAEVVMTDTARYADVILPACSHFEHADLFAAYGQQYLQRAEPVIPPVGEALPNTEIFRRLARRFGFGGPAFEADDAALMDDALDGASPALKGMRPSRLPVEYALSMEAPTGEATLFRTTFPATPSGRIELRSSYLERACGEPLPRWRPLASAFPLALLTPASNHRTSSTFGSLRYSDETWLEMHPADAATRNLREGMRVRVWNELGEVHLPLRITAAVRPGVVSSPKGAWLRTSDNGQTVSALVPAHTADLCDGACYNDARVEVAALATA
jgi:anaerobic selenocysteine-containing dehydrogenase